MEGGIESDHLGIQVTIAMESRAEHMVVTARRVRPLCWHLPEAEGDVDHTPLPTEFVRNADQRRWTDAYDPRGPEIPEAVLLGRIVDLDLS